MECFFWPWRKSGVGADRLLEREDLLETVAVRELGSMVEQAQRKNQQPGQHSPRPVARNVQRIVL